jgi:hypothetical protein
MSWKYYNPNPKSILVGDCVIRALSLALDQDWDSTYLGVTSKGYELKDMPSSNAIWMAYLKSKGFKAYMIPNECPDCYTVEDFCNDNRTGRFVLATGSHVITCINGDYYDTWDSGKEIPIYYFKKETVK